jgi:hypothetical protein
VGGQCVEACAPSRLCGCTCCPAGRSCDYQTLTCVTGGPG